MPLTVLLTGGRGMLGRTLTRAWAGTFRVVATDLPEADIRSALDYWTQSKGIDFNK